MKNFRSLALAFLALVLVPVFAIAQAPPVSGPTTYTFTAASQSNVWTCNGGQSSFQLSVPTGLTGTFTVTVGQSSTTATNAPPYAYAGGGSVAYTNTITNSGTLTVNLGSNLYVKVADTSYSSGSVTVSGVCSASVAVIPPQPTGPTPYPTPTATCVNPNCTASGLAITVITPTPGPALPISTANGGTGTSAPSPQATATTCAQPAIYTGTWPSQTLRVPACSANAILFSTTIPAPTTSASSSPVPLASASIVLPTSSAPDGDWLLTISYSFNPTSSSTALNSCLASPSGTTGYAKFVGAFWSGAMTSYEFPISQAACQSAFTPGVTNRWQGEANGMLGPYYETITTQLLWSGGNTASFTIYTVCPTAGQCAAQGAQPFTITAIPY